MGLTSFITELDECIAKYDLLCHPYYKAWSAGKLTKDDLCRYAAEYYHHVAALPQYMESAAKNVDHRSIKSALLQNKEEEMGLAYSDGRPHADLWLDFAEGMGGKKSAIEQGKPISEIQKLMDHFFNVSSAGSAVEILSTLYAYESQVPRVAAEKKRGLTEMYDADEKTCQYFTAHAIEDKHHAAVWSQLLEQEIERRPEQKDVALLAAEVAAEKLWQALDGVESARLAAR